MNKMNNMNNKKNIRLFVGVFLLFIFSCFSTFLLGLASAKNSPEIFNKEIFAKALKAIEEKSLYSLTEDEIYQGALKGVLAVLEEKNFYGSKNFKDSSRSPENSDSFNVLLSPSTSKNMETEAAGEISGIGVVYRYDPQKGDTMPIVEKIVPGSGASKDGLKVGDLILKIDGVPIKKFKELIDISNKIRGPIGSKVKLAILRDGEIINKNVRRDKVVWNTVESIIISPKIAYIKIRDFNQKTYQQMLTILKDVKSKKINHVILDLRNNSDGMLDQGIKTLELFAKKDQVLFKIKRGHNQIEIIKSKETGIAEGLKMVILVNAQTASLGEVSAVVLKNISNAIIVGEKTFGKASIETVYDLANDYKIKFTIGNLYDSNDKTWQPEGITPDIAIADNANNEGLFDEQKNTDPLIKLAQKYLESSIQKQ
ncbi:MAG: PDZ domain-containing protein [Oligoflexia bacterium]|nr:PDZ domain-containing protein [Oligoflexia bacterium]